MNILFVTWNGPEVTYIEGLFLPIFEGLSRRGGYKFHILQFTWGNKSKIEQTKAICESKGIKYQVINTTRKPVALGILNAIFFKSKTVRKYIIKNNIDVVMPRATTSAAICLKAVRNLEGVKLMFDADGLPQDERVDFGGWNPQGLQYRIYRDIEYLTLRKSNAILTRSLAAKEILAARAGAGFNKNIIHVITNGKKLEEEPFSNALSFESITTEGPNLIYAGSMGPQYCLQAMLKIFELVLKTYPGAKLNILTGNVNYASETVSKIPEVRGNVNILSVPAHEVQGYLHAADFGLALRMPSFSMLAVAPIKLSEYLLCGLPVIASKNIGDTEKYLKNSAAAFMLDDMTEKSLEASSSWIIDTYRNELKSKKEEAKALGNKYFNLDHTVELYAKAFESI